MYIIIYITCSISTAKVIFLWASFAIMDAQNLYRQTMNHKRSEHNCWSSLKCQLFPCEQHHPGPLRRKIQNPQLQGSAQLLECPALLLTIPCLRRLISKAGQQEHRLPQLLNSRVTQVQLCPVKFKFITEKQSTASPAEVCIGEHTLYFCHFIFMHNCPQTYSWECLDAQKCCFTDTPRVRLPCQQPASAVSPFVPAPGCTQELVKYRTCLREDSSKNTERK